MSTSIVGAIRTGFSRPDAALRNASLRHLDSNATICPAWNGVDSFGRESCKYGFASESSGCHVASSRVDVENQHRPVIMSSFNPLLNPYGISSAGFEPTEYLPDERAITGSAGLDIGGHISSARRYTRVPVQFGPGADRTARGPYYNHPAYDSHR